MTFFAAEDGTRLAFRDEGAGPPVLALAGLTRDGRDFDHVAPHLGGVRLIRLDCRGRGASEWSGPETYTIAREAADAVALLDHLGLERAAILGTSRGGLIAMALTAIAPGRMSGVLLNDIGPEIAPDGLDAIMGYLGLPPPWRSRAEAAVALARLPGFEGVPPGRWEAQAATFYAEGPEGLSLSYDPALRHAVIASGATPAPDLWPLFEALPAPLAALRGANSNLLTPETFAAMRRRRPDMLAAEVPGRGHVPFLDEPEALAPLRDWIAKL